MIVKASQRSGGRALAKHLLNLHDNDHVELHAIDGLTSPDVTGAFLEIEAMSRATRCKQPFFSVSISPPIGQTVLNVDFQNAIAQVAETMGLADQPRVILFHEKNARRHCHVVFSRIDAHEVNAINLPFFKNRLTEVSRELYLTHGFDLPKGLSDRSLADPTNYTLEEYQVAKRAKRDPREVKMAIKQCWARSDNGPAFAAALRERGFFLCRGDRRGFVALDIFGNVYSLSRWLDLKPKALQARLGNPESHSTVAETRAQVPATIGSLARRWQDELRHEHAAMIKPLLTRRNEMVRRQRNERKSLADEQRSRHDELLVLHSRRVRRGLVGMWDWITGRRGRIKSINSAEVERDHRADETEMADLRRRHIGECQSLQASIEYLRSQHRAKQLSLGQMTSFGHDPERHTGKRLEDRQTDHGSETGHDYR